MTNMQDIKGAIRNNCLHFRLIQIHSRAQGTILAFRQAPVSLYQANIASQDGSATELHTGPLKSRFFEAQINHRPYPDWGEGFSVSSRLTRATTRCALFAS